MRQKVDYKGLLLSKRRTFAAHSELYLIDFLLKTFLSVEKIDKVGFKTDNEGNSQKILLFKLPPPKVQGLLLYRKKVYLIDKTTLLTSKLRLHSYLSSLPCFVAKLLSFYLTLLPAHNTIPCTSINHSTNQVTSRKLLCMTFQQII